MKVRLRQVAGAIMVAALAGCGTATALPTARHRAGPPPGTRAWPGTRPASGSRAGSLRLARQLIARNVLPPGARRLPQRPIPSGLRQVSQAFGFTTSVDIYRLFALPATMRRTAAFLGSHAPAGMSSEGTGQYGAQGAVTKMDVSYLLSRLPRGIYSADLTDTIVPAPHRGALMRVDVQVIWYPPRSAAEHINPKNYRAVKVNAWLYGHSVRHVRRTLPARGVIVRLARLLNSLPASPGWMGSCPAEWATYQLTFEPVAPHPAVVVYTDGCASDTVSAGGAGQPALTDFGKLTSLVGKIMHVSPGPRP